METEKICEEQIKYFPKTNENENVNLEMPKPQTENPIPNQIDDTNFESHSSDGLDENDNVLDIDEILLFEDNLSNIRNLQDNQNHANKTRSIVAGEAPVYVNGKAVIRGGSEEQRFVCSFCDKAFALKHNLEYHMVIHTGERNFICGICNHSFSLRHHLTQHLVTHADDSAVSKHTCTICSKSFLHGYNLNRHLRTHTGEKRFFCELCNNSFANAYSLRNHLMIHSGDKPFSCEMCDKAFRKKCHLQRHVETHSNVSRTRKQSRRLAVVQKGKMICNRCQETFSSQTKHRNHDCNYVAATYVKRSIRKQVKDSTVFDDGMNDGVDVVKETSNTEG